MYYFYKQKKNNLFKLLHGGKIVLSLNLHVIVYLYHILLH